MSADGSLLSVSVVSLDFRMVEVSTSNEFVSSEDGAVPVIRIFGSTPAGQRCLVHVHGVYSYFYFRPAPHVPDAKFDRDDIGSRQSIEALHVQLEELMKQRRQTVAQAKYHAKYQHSFNRPVYIPPKDRPAIKALSVVKAHNIYGYHPEAQNFVRVHMVNPFDKRGLVELLEGGMVLNTCMQTWESHIPFLLQFTTDYGVVPMGTLRVDYAKFRHPLPPPPAPAPAPPPAPAAAPAPDAAGLLDPSRSSDAPAAASSSSPPSSNNWGGHGHCIFTQTSTPTSFQWVDESAIMPSVVEFNFDNMNTDNMSTQDIAKDPRILPTPSKEPKRERAAEAATMTKKESTCELEVDVHAHSLIGGTMHVPYHPDTGAGPTPSSPPAYYDPPLSGPSCSQHRSNFPHTFLSPDGEVCALEPSGRPFSAGSDGGACSATAGVKSTAAMLVVGSLPRSIWGATPPDKKSFGKELWDKECQRRCA